MFCLKTVSASTITSFVKVQTLFNSREKCIYVVCAEQPKKSERIFDWIGTNGYDNGFSVCLRHLAWYLIFIEF